MPPVKLPLQLLFSSPPLLLFSSSSVSLSRIFHLSLLFPCLSSPPRIPHRLPNPFPSRCQKLQALVLHRWPAALYFLQTLPFTIPSSRPSIHLHRQLSSSLSGLSLLSTAYPENPFGNPLLRAPPDPVFLLRTESTKTS
jgi:hypothetical protein